MDINEVNAERHKMELILSDMIGRFERRTGMRVSSVFPSHELVREEENPTPREYSVDVVVDISLPR